jgi:hypothetical protein
MALFTISLNQFVEASKATDKGKIRIVQQQLDINKFLIPWYQLAKNRIKLFFKNVYKDDVLKLAIIDLKSKTPKNDKDKRNIIVSQEAIHHVIGMRFEKILEPGYEVVTPVDKHIEIKDIVINVNPDVIFKYTKSDEVRIGALKFHVSKSKPFGLDQSKQIANITRMYLEQKVASSGEIVDESICFAYDVFAQRLISADRNVVLSVNEAKALCDELAKIYNNL